MQHNTKTNWPDRRETAHQRKNASKSKQNQSKTKATNRSKSEYRSKHQHKQLLNCGNRYKFTRKESDRIDAKLCIREKTLQNQSKTKAKQRQNTNRSKSEYRSKNKHKQLNSGNRCKITRKEIDRIDAKLCIRGKNASTPKQNSCKTQTKHKSRQIWIPKQKSPQTAKFWQAMQNHAKTN